MFKFEVVYCQLEIFESMSCIEVVSSIFEESVFDFYVC